MRALRDLDVLVVDCQAGGATPAYGDLLELGWARCGRDGAREVHAHWITRETNRPVPRPIRQLTGWSERCEGIAADDAWRRLLADAPAPPAPTVIHWARFEMPFLRRLHETSGDAGAFPLDPICLHAIAERLFPDLPRRNIRALAGHLGGSADLTRRSAGHVEASAFIWRALVPVLEEEAGVHTWEELATWLVVAPAPSRARGAKRVFPLAIEKRRALPDAPGVYRFVRKNGDVIYVGKAASLKKRVASHFTAARNRTHERALEMLTQVHDVVVSETASALEAALLESDEIKRIDPPYNVQLRTAERRAWFATRTFEDARDAPDDTHRIGPLPSRHALSGLAAIRRLHAGADPDEHLVADAVSVPPRFAPELALFAPCWRAFREEHLRGDVLAASRALWPSRIEDSPDDAPPSGWDRDRVMRHLERSLVFGGLLVRRARWLCVLCDASVEFREKGAARERRLVVASGEIRAGDEVVASRPRALAQRKASFDAARYDRMRVLATELRRVHLEGGEVRVLAGSHRIAGARLARILTAL
ncbi:MAG TPA: GIY-YIG nuclease family protein [Labilithrix sp.]